MTGTSTGDNCDVDATGNSGCGVTSNDASSYGPTFNAAGGGFYAMERSDAGVKVWFWSRNSGSIPSDVLNGATSVDTDNWGTPFADFPSTSCDMSSHFGPQKRPTANEMVRAEPVHPDELWLSLPAFRVRVPVRVHRRVTRLSSRNELRVKQTARNPISYKAEARQDQGKLRLAGFSVMDPH